MNRIYLSFAGSAGEHVEAVAHATEELGLRVTGRFTPIGGAFELVPDLRQQLRVSDAIVVVFGSSGTDDKVLAEIDWSYADGKGFVGVRLDPQADIPPLLYEAGAEILDWDEAADRERYAGAIRAAHRAAALMERARQLGTGTGASCARPPRPPA